MRTHIINTKDVDMGPTKPQATSTTLDVPLAERTTTTLLELRSIYYAEIESARYTMSSWDQQVEKHALLASYQARVDAITAELEKRKAKEAKTP